MHVRFEFKTYSPMTSRFRNMTNTCNNTCTVKWQSLLTENLWHNDYVHVLWQMRHYCCSVRHVQYIAGYAVIVGHLRFCSLLFLCMYNSDHTTEREYVHGSASVSCMCYFTIHHYISLYTIQHYLTIHGHITMCNCMTQQLYSPPKPT